MDINHRLTEMIYPDEEKITYSYNTGGQLESVKGEKAYSYNYVEKISYDEFGQRVYMKYGNGTETIWNYDEENRRLANLNVWDGTSGRNKIMDNTYKYDNVGNVLKITGNADIVPKKQGGRMTHTYEYDNLYRLIGAEGIFNGGATDDGNAKTASYSLAMTYDNLHNITSKEQAISQSHIQFPGTLSAGYNLKYNYNQQGKPHQIATLSDEDYRQEEDEEENRFNKEHKYTYDANGNLISVNIETKKDDKEQREKSKERQLLWNEENRLLAINDNGYISNYWYDAGGERVVKTSGENEAVYLNAALSGGMTELGRFTAYVNPYLVVSPQGRYTKHIYIGKQRIVSKLGDFESFGQDPRRVARAGQNVDGKNGGVNYDEKYNAAYDSIKSRYERIFDTPFNGKQNNDPVNGDGFCCKDNSALRAGNIGNGNDNPEKLQFYYHSDHLGSTSLITDLEGEVAQHVQYTPWGEVFIEERNNQWNTPFLFNAKELDEETGLYYFGMRYYNPRESIWLSVDPLAEKKPHVSSYAYCLNNPVRFIDPDGMDEWEINNKGEVNWIKESEKHTLFALDKDGNRTGKSLTLKDRKTFDDLATTGKASNYEKSFAHGNPSDLASVFLFAADNSDAEWRFSRYDTGNGDQYAIGTVHQNDLAISPDKMGFSRESEIAFIHSHPSKYTTTIQEYGSMGWEKIPDAVADFSRIERGSVSLLGDSRNVHTNPNGYYSWANNYLTYFPNTGNIYRVRGAQHPALIRNIKNHNNNPNRLFWGTLNGR